MYEIVQKQNNLFLYYYAYCLLRPGLSEVETQQLDFLFLFTQPLALLLLFPASRLFI